MSGQTEVLEAGGVLVLVDEVLDLLEGLPLDRKVTILTCACGVVAVDATEREAEPDAKRAALVQIFTRSIERSADIVVRNRAHEAAGTAPGVTEH